MLYSWWWMIWQISGTEYVQIEICSLTMIKVFSFHIYAGDGMYSVFPKLLSVNCNPKLNQYFQNCESRSTSGLQADFGWVAKHLNFFKKNRSSKKYWRLPKLRICPHRGSAALFRTSWWSNTHIAIGEREQGILSQLMISHLENLPQWFLVDIKQHVVPHNLEARVLNRCPPVPPYELEKTGTTLKQCC